MAADGVIIWSTIRPRAYIKVRRISGRWYKQGMVEYIETEG
jgi:hypothetical protein